MYKVVYYTTHIDGSLTKASGLIITPDSGASPQALLSYQHGTTVTRNLVPSSGNTFESLACAVFFGSAGYVVAAADYLGLGESLSFHPYLHAESTASTSADLLRAARHLQAPLGYTLNDQLFLTGYSQGGHATMGLHKYIEEKLPTEFKVTASSPMSGPFDLSDTSFFGAVNQPARSSTTYTAYLLQSMNQVYKIYDSLSDVVVDPFDTKIPDLFDGNHEFQRVQNILPAKPVDLLKPEYLDAILHDDTHPFRKALAQNNLYDWRPQAPVRLYGAKGDQDVPFANSEKTYRRMKELGADIELFNLGDDLNHGSAAIPAMTQTFFWFETLHQSFESVPPIIPKRTLSSPNFRFLIEGLSNRSAWF